MATFIAFVEAIDFTSQTLGTTAFFRLYGCDGQDGYIILQFKDLGDTLIDTNLALALSTKRMIECNEATAYGSKFVGLCGF
jgi:hypothetical protein